MLQKFLIMATLIVCLGFGIVTPEQDSKRVMSTSSLSWCLIVPVVSGKENGR